MVTTRKGYNQEDQFQSLYRQYIGITKSLSPEQGKHWRNLQGVMNLPQSATSLVVGEFNPPRDRYGSIDFNQLAAMMPPLLSEEEVPQSFKNRPCIRCGSVGRVARRCDGRILCQCFWTWYTHPERQSLRGRDVAELSA